MATDQNRAKKHLNKLIDEGALDDVFDRLGAVDESKTSDRVARPTQITQQAVDKRWGLIPDHHAMRAALFDEHTASQMEAYQGNIENFIGTAKLPIGLAGPLRVKGLHAQGDYYVPLATSEAALVASYTRGAMTLSKAGGATVAMMIESLSRAPAFVFESLQEVGRFVAWITDQFEAVRAAAEATTRHGKLVDQTLHVEANHVYLMLHFTTGDASGQNMVTIAAEAACRHIVAHSPVQPKQWYVEANMSGDKKASAQSFQTVRGKKVSAEITVPAPLLEQMLHATPKQMVDYWRVSALGGVMSGTIGVQGHYANGLAAMFIACGLDAACVAEAATGVTRFEVTDAGDLYGAVTLPNLIVGTVGGGTQLPSSRACLQIMGLNGPGHAAALAEVCGALMLAGELSIVSALASGQFTKAHQRLARRDGTKTPPANA